VRLFCVRCRLSSFRAFPVPLVGVGMSFPVGYWLGIALLFGKEHAIRKYRGRGINLETENQK
jgi:hypothetical protein